MPPPEYLRHVRIDGRFQAQNYVSPNRGGGTFALPPRDRVEHGTKLLDELRDAQARADAARTQAARPPSGLLLAFRSDPDLELSLKSLESERQGIELRCVREVGNVSEAVVYVPQGKIVYFTNKVQAFLDRDNTDRDGNPTTPKNNTLVCSVADIALAALKNLWTDHEPLPLANQTLWWEVWIDTEQDRLNLFRQEAAHVGLTLGANTLRFPDRAVLLAFGSLEQFEQSLLLIDIVAELRRAKECPTKFLNMRPAEQMHWVEDTLRRIQFAAETPSFVCLLDTGLNFEHPLLQPATEPGHVLTCFPQGNSADHDGHGTGLAGLTLYGDLARILADKEPVSIDHRLESVKILPAGPPNPPELYGAITAQGAYRIEAVNPAANRAYCLAITATDARDRGFPSSWSAELDQLAFGDEAGAPKRLFFVTAGNTNPAQRHNYPFANETDALHDPAQAWNAVCVGACTDRVMIQSPGFAGWQPVAHQPGTLSPSSTTSLIWKQIWPLKPDIVLEGGNSAINPANSEVDSIDDLSLLTTSRATLGRLFDLIGDTSAATALAARMAAIIQAQYPDYWPETVRALMIHSAEWTPGMLAQFPGDDKAARQRRLRCVGFGVPSLDRALWCARNALTLVAQTEIQPFDFVEGRATFRHINLHDLPWPTEVLRALGETPVSMRVTLSYFIEPSPGCRGWKYSHRYASHGLRFDVKRPTESNADFQRRLNREARAEEDNITFADDVPWTLGRGLRSRGSVHSDWWHGIASDLANCSHIGVYPVTGWWRERPKFERWQRRVRYALVVSIAAPGVEVDLYTPVTTQIDVSAPVVIR